MHWCFRTTVQGISRNRFTYIKLSSKPENCVGKKTAVHTSGHDWLSWEGWPRFAGLVGFIGVLLTFLLLTWANPSNPQHQVPSPQGWRHFLTSKILQDLAAFGSILFASVFGLPSNASINGSIRQYCHFSQCSLLSTQTQSLGQRMLG